MNDIGVLTLRGRLLLAAMAVVAMALIAMARGLRPDPRGYGTHEQLGLAPCGFTSLTGWRCPTCGMTTAWSHAARGDVRAALAASGGGTMLFGLAIAASSWALASAVAGKQLGGRPTPRLLLGIGGAWLTVTALDWARRLVAG